MTVCVPIPFAYCILIIVTPAKAGVHFSAKAAA